MAGRKTDKRWLAASLIAILAGVLLRHALPLDERSGEQSGTTVKRAGWTNGIEPGSDGTQTYWAATSDASAAAGSPPRLLAAACGPQRAGIFVNAGELLRASDSQEPRLALRTCRVRAGLFIELGAATPSDVMQARVEAADTACREHNTQVRARWQELPKVTIVVSRGREALPALLPGHFEKLFAAELPARVEQWRDSTAFDLMQPDAQRLAMLTAMQKADRVTVSHGAATQRFAMDGAAALLTEVAAHCPDQPVYETYETPIGSTRQLLEGIPRANTDSQ